MTTRCSPTVTAFQKSAKSAGRRHHRHAARSRPSTAARRDDARVPTHPRQHGALALDAARPRRVLRARQRPQLRPRRLSGRRRDLQRRASSSARSPTRRRSSPTRSRTSSSIRAGTSRPRSRSRRCCRRSAPIRRLLRGYEVFAKVKRPLPRRSTPYFIDWQHGRHPQDPDPPAAGRARMRSAQIKFMFPNQYAVYLHDTPSKSLFQRD